MTPLNIVHFSQDFREGKSQLGAFSRIYNLTNDGNHHIIFTIHFEESDLVTSTLDHLTIVRVGIGKLRIHVRNEWQMARIISKKILSYLYDNPTPIDILFGHSQLVNFYVLDNVRRQLRVPYIWELNVFTGLPLRHGRFSLINVYRYFGEWIAYHRADHLVAQTARSKQTIQTDYHISSQKISVITNSVNLEEYSTRKVYQQKGEKRRLRVYFIGRFDTLNGLNFIIDNIATLNSVGIDLYLLGDGSNVETVKRLHQQGKLTYLGTVPRNQMLEEYLQADILLIPRVRCFLSDHYIPTKLLEAMAVGLIVLGSDVAGITEVLRDGENGFIFKAEDPVAMVKQLQAIEILDDSYKQQISNTAIEVIRAKFTMTKNNQQLDDIYRKVLQS